MATSPDERPTVAAAARAWYEQAKAAYAKAHGRGARADAHRRDGRRRHPRRLLDGDGSREAREGFRERRAAACAPISSPSAASPAAASAPPLSRRLWRNATRTNAQRATATCPLATTFLTADFLAPALASLVFVDTPSSFLPDLGQGDRGTALEKSFEHASGGLLARPFLSFFPYKKDLPQTGRAPWRPILLLNATHEETGKRIITGHVLIERNVFIDSLDALHVLGKDVRASTAAHNSARFTYISPAGDLGDKHGSVIDGGYFENYGALSALELARAARQALRGEAAGSQARYPYDQQRSGPRASPRAGADQRGQGRRKMPGERRRARRRAARSRRRSQTPAGSPNYLSFDQKQVENAWLNEFLAPVPGHQERARGARKPGRGRTRRPNLHGISRTAKSGSGPAHHASPARRRRSRHRRKPPARSTKQRTRPSTNSSPVEASHDNPYFAHLAMCEEGQPAPVQPPLGWVLSKATQEAFGELLNQCGNDHELSQLEIALGRQAPQQAASR